MKKRELAVGVIGVGHLGKLHLENVINNKEVYCSGIYDIDKEKSKKIIDKFLNASVAKDKEGIVLYSNSPHIHPLLKFAYMQEIDSLPFEDNL